MARAKRRRQERRNQHRAAQVQSQHPKSSRLEWLRRWAIDISAAVAIASLFFGLYEFRPQISVSPEMAPDPSDAVSAPFVVTNVGRTAIYSVSRSCYFHMIHTLKRGRYTLSFTTLEIALIPRLDAEDRSSFRCRSGNEGDDRFIEADLSIFVDYRWSYWPWRKTKEVRFYTVRDSAGGVRWLPYQFLGAPTSTERGDSRG